MKDAYWEDDNPDATINEGFSEEIRALADWLVPEETLPPDYITDPKSQRQRERQLLRKILLLEAELAERDCNWRE